MSDDDREVDAPDTGDTFTAHRRQHALEEGILRVREMIESCRGFYAADCIAAKKRDEDPPKADLPRAGSESWVGAAARKLGLCEVPKWFPHSDLVALGEDCVSRTLGELRTLPEFTALGEPFPVGIAIRWTAGVVARKDRLGNVDYNEARCGRVKAVPEVERLTWQGPGVPPLFRFELSLPWFLLAEDDEIEHGLHDLLAYCGLTGRDEDPKPRLRKPDVVAHASTLARFGPRHHREARAVAHAQAHPQGRALLQAHGYDPASGQGLIWPDIDTHRRRSSALFPAPERAGAKARPQAAQPRVGKEIAADPEPLFVADPDEEMEH